MKKREYLTVDKTMKFLDRALWARLARMLLEHKAGAAIAFSTIILSQFIPNLHPLILKKMVDGPIAQGNMQGMYALCGWYLAVVIISGALGYIGAVASQALALKIIHQLRIDLYSHIIKYKLDFYKRTPVGRLMTRLTSDIDNINSMFSEGLIDLMGAVLMLIFPMVFMLYLNWKLALATLAITPLMFLATGIFRVKVRDINTKIRKSIAALNTQMQESLSGNYLVQIFGKSRQKWEEFDTINTGLKNQWLINVRYYALFFPVMHSLTEISVVILYFLGGWLFFKEQVSLGILVSFSMWMGMFWRPLRDISERFTQLQTALAAAERVFTLFEINANIEAGDKDMDVSSQITLSFENVSFGYEVETPVLRDISFTLQESRSLAIVGATGSGKSTLISLCNKFYLPDSGCVKINGIKVQDYKEGAIQALTSFVPQDVYLFAETVAYNIALTKDYDLGRMKEVCEYVNADKFISGLPDAYEHKLTERGANLSLGQRQLLAFARAIYHRPRLLLLDEATSSIDTETELLIQDAMGKFARDMTSIVVAHRLSTIKACHQIMALHKGEIREVGTHDELIAKKGIYHKLYMLQGVDAGVGGK